MNTIILLLMLGVLSGASWRALRHLRAIRYDIGRIRLIHENGRAHDSVNHIGTESVHAESG